jgi:hypothetical protein
MLTLDTRTDQKKTKIRFYFERKRKNETFRSQKNETLTSLLIPNLMVKFSNEKTCVALPSAGQWQHFHGGVGIYVKNMHEIQARAVKIDKFRNIKEILYRKSLEF